VTRDVDPRNRRSVLIKLTDSGRELIDRVVTSHVAFETQLLDQLSRKDQKHLARLLRALLISLGDSAPGNPLNPE
jgi:DNA-binding MarR family transcriptional regulator